MTVIVSSCRKCGDSYEVDRSGIHAGRSKDQDAATIAATSSSSMSPQLTA